MKTKDELLLEINNSSQEELIRMAFTYLKVKDHIEYNLTSDKEDRTREKMRLLIAKRTLERFYNSFI